MILTKGLVTTTDQCTEYQFKSPIGESYEDIYNKNPERVMNGLDITGSQVVESIVE